MTTKAVILLLIIVSISCKNDNNQNNSINGNLIGINKKMSIILESRDSLAKFRVDSIKGIDNVFKFVIPKSETPKEYWVTIFNDSLKKQITSEHLWFENENISISGNLSELSELQIKGGKLNEIQKDFNNTFVKYNTPEFDKELMSAKTQEETAVIYQKYKNLIELDQLSLIYKKPNNLISLSKMLRMSDRVSKDSLELYYNQLDDNLKSSKNGQIILEQSKITKLKIGDYVQDFTAFDLEGNIVKLSDFKDKIILLDFWASWCVPCHQQNQKEFSELYKKYKNQNLEIISYSLDIKTAKEDWRKASLTDKISWINISNLKGFDDPIDRQYNVSSVPTSFLIDQKGIIVNSFTGYNPENSEIEIEIRKLIDK